MRYYAFCNMVFEEDKYPALEQTTEDERKQLHKDYMKKMLSGERNEALNTWENAICEDMKALEWSGEDNCKRFGLTMNMTYLGYYLPLFNMTTMFRQEFVLKYSWAIPNEAALNTILKYGSKIVEIGSGSGYWASLLRKKGANILAVDDQTEEFSQQYHPIIKSDGKKYLLSHAEECEARTLLMIWSRSNFIDEVIEAYNTHQGETIILISELQGGSTGVFNTEKFRDWKLEESSEIPVWLFKHDSLQVYRRKKQ